MTKYDTYKQIAKHLLILLSSIALIRFSQGLWLGVMAIMGVVWALSGKAGKALSMYVIVSSMVSLNPIILPMGGTFGVIARFGPLIIGLALMLKGVSLRGQSRVPLGILIVYLCFATISSINGWAPIVSLLKILNFAVFILGFWFGLHTLSSDPGGAVYLRMTFIAFSAFLILGSAILLPFPGISTLSGFQLAVREGDLEVANAAMADIEGAIPLFCGVTRQSQAFAVLASVSLAWVLADMLFVEQRFEKLHLLILVVGMVLVYYSRSRTGLLSLFVAVIMVAVYLPRKIIGLTPDVKRRVKNGVSAILVIGVVAAAYSEIVGSSMSQWLRKVDDVKDDTRSLTEAVTSSRQGLMDESMRDFRRNPLFGSGFQVAEEMADFVAKSGSSFILSAPIEKGVLPIMVLGETGIVGEIAFLMFLVSFYSVSSRRKLLVTAALFTVFLATNMGEATFFSPGGVGAILWAMSVIGGYCIDMHLHKARNPYNISWR